MRRKRGFGDSGPAPIFQCVPAIAFRPKFQPGRIPGFTLIEVLIALAVVAIALLALTRAASVQVGSFDGLRERTLAGWVAANVLAETRLPATPPAAGRSDGRVQFAGRGWRWEREIRATDNPQIRRIDIHVFAGDSRAPSSTLSGFGGGALSQ